MEIRRYKNIAAFKFPNPTDNSFSYIAFHSKNMEVAEISETAFNKLPEIDYISDTPPTELTNNNYENEAHEQIIEWNNETNTNVKSGKISQKIKSISISVSQICNLKCSYCAAGGDGTYGEPITKIEIEKTLPQLKFFMSKLSRGENFAISIVGGEPLLALNEVYSIYEYVWGLAKDLEVKPSLKLVTNGTLINENSVNILRKMDINLTISIDGTKQVTDQLRPSKDGKSTTDKIIEGLKLINSNRGKINKLTFSIVNNASNNDIYSNFLFLNSLNPDLLDITFANEETSKLAQNNFISGVSKICSDLWSIGGEKSLRRLVFIDHFFKILDSQIQLENHCGAGKSYLMIDAKNRLYNCVWDPNNKNTSIGQGTDLDLTKSPNLSKPLIELNNCQTCWAKHLCGGGCMYINEIHSGNKHLKNNLFCERIRHLISIAIVYYKLARAGNN